MVPFSLRLNLSAHPDSRLPRVWNLARCHEDGTTWAYLAGVLQRASGQVPGRNRLARGAPIATFSASSWILESRRRVLLRLHIDVLDCRHPHHCFLPGA